MYFSLVTAIKISILLTYRRIFSVDPKFRLQSLSLGGIVLTFWLVASIVRVFLCHPVGYVWMGIALDKHCSGHRVFWLASGITEAIIDLLILALPARTVLRLQLSSKRKVLITLVFVLGGLQVFFILFFVLKVPLF